MLEFPDGWDVEMRPMAGHDRPEISMDAVRHAVRNPISKPPLRDLAEGKKQVVIIVDVTVNQWAKPVGVWAGDFREAWQAGLPDAQQKFVTEGRHDQDIVVANCFYKASEDLIGLMVTPRSLKQEGARWC